MTAVAHPNIALVKYWGKQDKPGNLPATPNISITLDTLQTRTSVTVGERDTVVMGGAAVQDQKIADFLATLRTKFDIPPLAIETENNFPTGAGLASSASGFAALMLAINTVADLNLDEELMSEWARQGSASAARSFFGGYVALVPPLWRAQPVATEGHWPLAVAVAITSDARKAVSSTTGMQASAATSPFYKTWVHQASGDFADANDAIAARDFQKLAEVAELNCLKMHSVMLTTSPTLAYWNEASLSCMDAVRAMRVDGTPVFFTIDAGPQIKAVCEPSALDQVATSLEAIPGVRQVLRCNLGPGAHLIG